MRREDASGMSREKTETSALPLTHSLSSSCPPLSLLLASLDTTRGPPILAASTVPSARARNSPPTAAFAASEVVVEVGDISEEALCRSSPLSFSLSLHPLSPSVSLCNRSRRVQTTPLSLSTSQRKRETERGNRGRENPSAFFQWKARRKRGFESESVGRERRGSKKKKKKKRDSSKRASEERKTSPFFLSLSAFSRSPPLLSRSQWATGRGAQRSPLHLLCLRARNARERAPRVESRERGSRALPSREAIAFFTRKGVERK